MDYIKQNRIMGWSVMLLVVLNALALGALWWTRLAPPAPGTEASFRRFGQGTGRMRMRRSQDNPPDVADFIERELSFDTEQTQALRTLRRQFFEDSFQVRESIHTMKRNMMEAVFASETDANHIDEMASKIGQLHTRMELIQSNHFEEIRRLCRPDQKAQFMHLLNNILHMTRPEAPGSPGGGRGGPQMRGGRRGPMGEFPGGPRSSPENGF
ncbi:MAG: periplasmic heavy metal sensor [Planctomycetes bacterium]|nr:periplasmic heavy metal sensor [Planctomycetota bacterium]